MKANELLLWLSARKHGSWEQFKGAVESLHLPDDSSTEMQTENNIPDRGGGLPLYQQLRINLGSLAHVEFFADGCREGWRVAPPGLAAHQHDQGCTAILCGARSTTLLGQLTQAALGKASIETEEHEACPLVHRIHASDIESLEGIARQAGLFFQREATLAILGSIPPVSDRLFLHSAELRLGTEWQVDQFSTETLRWSPSGRKEAAAVREGLFRFRLPYERVHFLRLRGQTYEVAGQVAKFVLLRRHRRSILRYDAATRALSMPASCRPPQMIDRALVLGSGRLPVFDVQQTQLTYNGVPILAARIAARLLCQEF